MTHGLFIGERHAYVSPQIDDFFLTSAIYASASTYRITAADLQAFANWQRARRADAADRRSSASSFAFNAHGARPTGQDALTDKALGARADVRRGSTTPGTTRT